MTKCALFAVALLGLVSVARADVVSQFSVNTSSVSGTSGSLDFQFNPGPLVSQLAFLQILSFSTDGMLAGGPSLAGDVSGGPLPATVTFDNGGGFNDYFEGFTFGSILSFTTRLYGPAVDAPDGTSTSGSTFVFSMFSDAAGTMPVLTNDLADGFAAQLDLDLSGKATPTNFSSQTTVTGSSPAPEPGSFWLFAGALLVTVLCHWRSRPFCVLSFTRRPTETSMPLPRRAIRFLSVFAICLGAYGQSLVSGSTGADGDFVPPNSVPPGTTLSGFGTDCFIPPILCTVTVPLREPPNNIYNFRAVTISFGYTVKFTRNLANTPVILLATGDVSIHGTIDVSGADGQNSAGVPNPGLGGPGGFSGGVGAVPGAPTFAPGAGLGPGGGGLGAKKFGSFADGDPNLIYGIPALQPLIGGSGGQGIGIPTGGGQSGGGGGGALLIAASGTLDLGSGSSCAVYANGGASSNGSVGTGGAIRLVATNLKGSSCLNATFGSSENNQGRIRLESAQLSQYTGPTNPPASMNDPILGPPITVFPAITPTLDIVSVGGLPLPGQPTTNASTPGLTLLTSSITVVLQATHVPSGTPVQILVAPQFGSGQATIVNATLTGAVGQPKRVVVAISLPPTGAGNISAVIRSPFVPEQ